MLWTAPLPPPVSPTRAKLSEQRHRQEAPVSIAATPPATSIIAAVRWKTATHRRCRSITPPWPRSSECPQVYQQRRPTPCRDAPPRGRLNLLVPPIRAKRRSIPPPWPRSSSPERGAAEQAKRADAEVASACEPENIDTGRGRLQ